MKIIDKMFKRYEPVFVYILECEDGTLYTGITNNIQRRLFEHRIGKGALYTRIHGVKRLLGYRQFKNRSIAMQEERRVKQLRQSEKRKLALQWRARILQNNE